MLTLNDLRLFQGTISFQNSNNFLQVRFHQYKNAVIIPIFAIQNLDYG